MARRGHLAEAEHTIADLPQRGQFRSLAASLRTARRDASHVQVQLHPRRAAGDIIETLAVDVVIVTTRPAHGGVIVSNPALASLAEAGWIRLDQVGLGLDVDPDNHAVGSNGLACRSLLVAGLLARGQVGELMGLPQVSEHADMVAETAAVTLLSMPRRPHSKPYRICSSRTVRINVDSVSGVCSPAGESWPVH